MKKELNGAELAGFIKERQANEVRRLKQQFQITPKLAIIRTNPDPVVDSYMRIKKASGEDIGAEVDVHQIEQSECIDLIKSLNQDDSVHGILVQIPLPDKSQTDEVLNTVSRNKDVDGLALKSDFDAPTAVAINWLLAGYAVELKSKNLAIVGAGRLVGKPLAKLWQDSGLTPDIFDKKSLNAKSLQQADVVVSATGVPGLIAPEMIKPDAVIVDAGVAEDSNGLVGDVSAEVREMPDIIITPEKGGVGPLTVTALFENVITAARNSIGSE